MKKVPLQFTIPKPCKESFADMPQSGEGRFCGKCETIIYDFSQMTDAELIRFFEAKPETHCGRFHNSQLNRVIEPVKIRNGFFKRFAKIAASVIAILTLRSAPAKAQGEMRPLIAQNPPVNKKPVSTSQKVLLIKGTVKDGDGKPLKNTVVKFDDLKSTTTDENGAYSFELSGINEPHNIYFDLPDYVRAVRNFHPAMGSEMFDVILIKRDPTKFHSGFTGGVIAYTGLENLPALNFKTNIYKLSAENKAMLLMVATKMKSSPHAGIMVETYPATCGKQYIWQRRLDAVRDYLIKKHGISPDRISTNAEAGGGEENIVVLSASY